MAHVSNAKKEIVKEFLSLIDQYPIVGVVNMEGLPAPQLQQMRASLRDDGVVLKMTKKRVLKIILQEADKKKAGLSAMSEKIKGSPALICAKENPFKLYKKLQKSKSPAPAKGGQEAPNDIIVPAGPTSFAPGPIIGELGGFKIKAGIDGGKVVIKEDSLVAKAGEKISAGLAAVLTRLEIHPMEIGLDLTAVWEDGTVFEKDVLAIDEDQFIQDIMQAHRDAFSLAVDCAIPNAQTTELLVTKAFTDAKALALEAAIVSKEYIDELLAKAEGQAQSIKKIVD